MAITIDQIKQLRDKTQASVSVVKAALVEADGDMKKAEEVLKKKGFESAAKKADRVAGEGLIETYVHGNGKIGVILELNCETDFVAKTGEFKELAHEVAMQVAAMNPENVEELLKQDYIRDGSKKIEDMVKESIARVGENIVLKRFKRFEIGQV